MSTDLRTRKLANRFRQLDVNGDGRLQRDDLEAVASRLCEKLVPAARTAERHAIAEGYRKLWDHLVKSADINSDGQVSEEEYITAAASNTTYVRTVQDAMSVVFDVLDTNNDGRLGRAEAAAWSAAMQLSADDADRLFDRLDADHTGTITKAEVLAAIEDFYSSDDTDTAGAILFGEPR